MQIESRFFADETDTRCLIEFLGAANQMSRGYWHPGDLVWALNQTTTFDPRASIRLWENDGELLGFTIHEASNLVTAQIHPRLRAEGRLTTTMFEWAASHTRALLEREGDPEPSIWTKALNSDDATLRVLADQGFARDDYHYLHLRRELSEAPAAAPLPAGMRIKHISDEAEYAQRRVASRSLAPVQGHPGGVPRTARRPGLPPRTGSRGGHRGRRVRLLLHCLVRPGEQAGRIRAGGHETSLPGPRDRQGRDD